MTTPSIPKGTRDFAPEVMGKRNYIFSVIRKTFERFGYLPLETPSLENLDTLTGKYGEEGDQLIFKVLNNGDFLKAANEEALQKRDSKKLAISICDRALRYDLTVPFARFVAMNRHQLAFPFKRYQIQPVWRADRPQKGRYREFYQCDADVVGSNSLLNEVELVQIFDQALSELNIPSFTIRINNRKILSGIAEIAGVAHRMMEMTIAIDKLDKTGEEGVIRELTERGFGENSIDVIKSLLLLKGTNEEKLAHLQSLLKDSSMGQKGVEELNYIFSYSAELGLRRGKVEFDITLARGLNYYTGAIFEVKADNVEMGSICGGGRYDDLTGIFGLPGVSGVGISFGADRICDVMNELQLFPSSAAQTTRLLFANFGAAEEKYSMQLLKKVRQAGVNAEIYPEAVKIKKQFKYADDKGIPFVASVGNDEMNAGLVSVRNMQSGEQKKLPFEALIAELEG
ncbi:MAG: histidine--tRNA ligase [Crocinitomicaceae bacterium]|nr:histidine--tRNA ligase [Crocinitomicaceae bacterium]